MLDWKKIAVSVAVFGVARYLLGLGMLWAVLLAVAVYIGWIVFGGCKGDATTSPANG